MSGHSPRSDAGLESPVARARPRNGTRLAAPTGSEYDVHGDVSRRHLEERRFVATRRGVGYEHDDEDGTDDDDGLDEVRGTEDDATGAETTVS